MTPTMPELGWTGRVGVSVFVMLLVAGIVLYHLWMDRRLKRERERSDERREEEYQGAGELNELGRRGDARQRIPTTEL
jgi:hypothetical protein